LRQICINLIDKDLWWNYVIEFGKKCPLSPEEDACAKNTMESVGLYTALVEDCMSASFRSSSNSPVDQRLDDNALLAEERSKQNDRAISQYPSLLINGKLYTV